MKTAGIFSGHLVRYGEQLLGKVVLHAWVIGVFQQCNRLAGWLVGYIFTMYLQTSSDFTKFVLRNWVLDVYICSDGFIYVSLNLIVCDSGSVIILQNPLYLHCSAKRLVRHFSSHCRTNGACSCRSSCFICEVICEVN